MIHEGQNANQIPLNSSVKADSKEADTFYLLGINNTDRSKIINQLRENPEQGDNKEIDNIKYQSEVIRRIHLKKQIDIVDLPLNSEFKVDHIFRGVIYVLQKDEIEGEVFLKNNCRMSSDSFLSSSVNISNSNSNSSGPINIGSALKRLFEKSINRERKKNEGSLKESLPLVFLTSFQKNANVKKIKQYFEECLFHIFQTFRQNFTSQEIKCDDLLSLIRWTNAQSLRDEINQILIPLKNQILVSLNTQKQPQTVLEQENSLLLLKPETNTKANTKEKAKANIKANTKEKAKEKTKEKAKSKEPPCMNCKII